VARTDPAPVRVYGSLRTAHLERLGRMVPARMLYTGNRDDFDLGAVDLAEPPIRLSRAGVLRELLRTHHPVVELNEPAMVDRWAFLLAQVAAVRLRSLVARRRTVITSYCIGNADPVLEIQQRWRIAPPAGRLLARVMMSLLVSLTDRLAFGTDGAVQMYERYVGPDRLRRRARLFEALPSPCPCLAEADQTRDPHQLVFVGSFVERKGVPEVLAAWDGVRARVPDATFVMMGKGRLTDHVLAWAADRPEVSVRVDPPRDAIHRVLRSSGALVMLSQPHRYWREQIGLPLLEGLGHGCEVVTTTETGLAAWLGRHGHGVVPPDASTRDMTEAVVAALERAGQHRDVLGDLPRADQRIVADRWMMTGSVSS
jgi:glycosyltransferase involved in cell wall biosynthesis